MAAHRHVRTNSVIGGALEELSATPSPSAAFAAPFFSHQIVLVIYRYLQNPSGLVRVDSLAGSKHPTEMARRVL